MLSQIGEDGARGFCESPPDPRFTGSCVEQTCWNLIRPGGGCDSFSPTKKVIFPVDEEAHASLDRGWRRWNSCSLLHRPVVCQAPPDGALPMGNVRHQCQRLILASILCRPHTGTTAAGASSLVSAPGSGVLRRIHHLLDIRARDFPADPEGPLGLRHRLCPGKCVLGVCRSPGGHGSGALALS